MLSRTLFGEASIDSILVYDRHGATTGTVLTMTGNGLLHLGAPALCLRDSNGEVMSHLNEEPRRTDHFEFSGDVASKVGTCMADQSVWCLVPRLLAPNKFFALEVTS